MKQHANFDVPFKLINLSNIDHVTSLRMLLITCPFSLPFVVWMHLYNLMIAIFAVCGMSRYYIRALIWAPWFTAFCSIEWGTCCFYLVLKCFLLCIYMNEVRWKMVHLFVGMFKSLSYFVYQVGWYKSLFCCYIWL